MKSVKPATAASFLSAVRSFAPVTLAAQDTDLTATADFFSNAQIVDDPRDVDCKLSGGTETCGFSITVVAQPDSYMPGSGLNAIPGCLSAEYGCHSNDADAVCDATARPLRL